MSYNRPWTYNFQANLNWWEGLFKNKVARLINILNVCTICILCSSGILHVGEECGTSPTLSFTAALVRGGGSSCCMFDANSGKFPLGPGHFSTRGRSPHETIWPHLQTFIDYLLLSAYCMVMCDQSAVQLSCFLEEEKTSCQVDSPARFNMGLK